MRNGGYWLLGWVAMTVAIVLGALVVLVAPLVSLIDGKARAEVVKLGSTLWAQFYE